MNLLLDSGSSISIFNNVNYFHKLDNNWTNITINCASSSVSNLKVKKGLSLFGESFFCASIPVNIVSLSKIEDLGFEIVYTKCKNFTVKNIDFLLQQFEYDKNNKFYIAKCTDYMKLMKINCYNITNKSSTDLFYSS